MKLVVADAKPAARRKRKDGPLVVDWPMHRLPVVLASVIVLAGCAAEEEVNPSPTTGTTTGTPEPTAEPPGPVTNQLFFLKPTGSTPETTPYSFAGGFGGAPPRWEHRIVAEATPAGADASVWVRVIEPLFVPTNQSACAWSMQVFAEDEPIYPILCSGPSGPIIQPGDYELRFSGDSTANEALPVGTTLAFAMGRAGFSPTPNEAAVILTSSENFASNVVLEGLKEPLPNVS
jgi:hypothetical protein